MRSVSRASRPSASATSSHSSSREGGPSPGQTSTSWWSASRSTAEPGSRRVTITLAMRRDSADRGSGTPSRDDRSHHHLRRLGRPDPRRARHAFPASQGRAGLQGRCRAAGAGDGNAPQPAVRERRAPLLTGLNGPGASLYNGLYAAGWSSLVARRAHNPKVAGSNPAPAMSLRVTGGPQRKPPLARGLSAFWIRSVVLAAPRTQG